MVDCPTIVQQSKASKLIMIKVGLQAVQRSMVFVVAMEDIKFHSVLVVHIPSLCHHYKTVLCMKLFMQKQTTIILFLLEGNVIDPILLASSFLISINLSTYFNLVLFCESIWMYLAITLVFVCILLILISRVIACNICSSVCGNWSFHSIKGGRN